MSEEQPDPIVRNRAEVLREVKNREALTNAFIRGTDGGASRNAFVDSVAKRSALLARGSEAGRLWIDSQVVPSLRTPALGRDTPENRSRGRSYRVLYRDTSGRCWEMVGVWQSSRKNKRLDVEPGDRDERWREWRPIGHTARVRRLDLEKGTPRTAAVTAEQVDELFARAREVGPVIPAVGVPLGG